MNTFLDVETIPDQREGALDKITEKIEVKAPEENKPFFLKAFNLDAKDKTTVPELKKMWVEEFGAQAKLDQAKDKWLKTSLDGGFGELICLSFAMGGGDIISHQRALGESEADMLQNAFDDLVGKDTRPPFFIGHNIPFDLKFLYRRAVVLGVKPCFKLPFSGRHDQHYFDTMQAWAGFNGKISQDDLCEILGIEKKPDGIDGSKVWQFVEAGKIAEVVEYNRYDVDTVRQIHKRLNF